MSSLGSSQSMADVTRIWRRAISARGWRLYAISGFAAVLAVFGTVVAVNAQAAPAHRAPGKILSPATPASPALAGFTQGFVAISDSTIHYVIGGHGPVLVLLHGWPMTWWEWHLVMPSLAKHHTVVAFDLPGLGGSTVPTSGGYTAVDTAQRLHQAVTALGFGHISILGHDLGVNVAYAYAELYPRTVTKLAVLDSLLNGFGLESVYGFSFHFDLNMAASPMPESIINNHAAERGVPELHVLARRQASRYHQPGQEDMVRRLCQSREPRGRLQLLPSVPGQRDLQPRARHAQADHAGTGDGRRGQLRDRGGERPSRTSPRTCTR